MSQRHEGLAGQVQCLETTAQLPKHMAASRKRELTTGGAGDTVSCCFSRMRDVCRKSYGSNSACMLKGYGYKERSGLSVQPESQRREESQPLDQ